RRSLVARACDGSGNAAVTSRAAVHGAEPKRRDAALPLVKRSARAPTPGARAGLPTFVHGAHRAVYPAGVSARTFDVDLPGLHPVFGGHLYSSPGVFARELVQNAVDAVTERRRVEPSFAGRVRVRGDAAACVV